MKAIKEKRGKSETKESFSEFDKNKELHTEGPLAEKDEVKKAEKRTQDAQKKADSAF